MGIAVLAASVSNLKERDFHDSREEVVVDKKVIERKTAEEINDRITILNKQIDYVMEKLKYLHKSTHEIAAGEYLSLLVEIATISDEVFKNLRGQISMLKCGFDREQDESHNGLLTIRLKTLWSKVEKAIILYGRVLSSKEKSHEKHEKLFSEADNHYKKIESVADTRHNAFNFFEERTLFLVEVLLLIGTLEERQESDLKDEAFKKYNQISAHMHAARFVSDTEIVVDRSLLEQ